MCENKIIDCENVEIYESMEESEKEPFMTDHLALNSGGDESQLLTNDSQTMEPANQVLKTEIEQNGKPDSSLKKNASEQVPEQLLNDIDDASLGQGVRMSSTNHDQNTHTPTNRGRPYSQIQPTSLGRSTCRQKSKDTEMDAIPATPVPRKEDTKPFGQFDHTPFEDLSEEEDKHQYEREILRPKDHQDKPLCTEDLIDVVIVYAKSDYELAIAYMEWLYSISKPLGDVKIELYTSDHFPANDVRVVEDVVNKSMRVLMLLSTNFEKEVSLTFIKEEAIGLTRLQELSDCENTSLFATAIMNRKKNCVRPVHTVHKKRRYYKTPAGLSALRAFSFFTPDIEKAYERDTTKQFLKSAMEDRKYHMKELEGQHSRNNIQVRQTVEAKKAEKYLYDNTTNTLDQQVKNKCDPRQVNHNVHGHNNACLNENANFGKTSAENYRNRPKEPVSVMQSEVVGESLQQIGERKLGAKNLTSNPESTSLPSSAYASSANCANDNVRKIDLQVLGPRPSVNNNSKVIPPHAELNNNSNTNQNDQVKKVEHAPSEDSSSRVNHNKERKTKADTVHSNTPTQKILQPDNLNDNNFRERLPSENNNPGKKEDIEEDAAIGRDSDIFKESLIQDSSLLSQRQNDNITMKGRFSEKHDINPVKYKHNDFEEGVKEHYISYTEPSGRSGMRSRATPNFEDYVDSEPRGGGRTVEYKEYMSGAPRHPASNMNQRYGMHNNNHRPFEPSLVFDSNTMPLRMPHPQMPPSIPPIPNPSTVHYHYHYGSMGEEDVEADEGLSSLQSRHRGSRERHQSPRPHVTPRSPIRSGPVFNIQGCATVQIGDKNQVVGDQHVRGTNVSGSNDDGEEYFSSSSTDLTTSSNGNDTIEEPTQNFGGQAEESFNNLNLNDHIEINEKRVDETSEDDTSDDESEDENTIRKLEDKSTDNTVKQNNFSFNLCSSLSGKNVSEKCVLAETEFPKDVQEANQHNKSSTETTQLTGATTTSVNMTSQSITYTKVDTSLEFQSLSAHLRAGTRRKGGLNTQYYYCEQLRYQTNRKSDKDLCDDDID